MAGNLAGLSLEDPGHIIGEYHHPKGEKGHAPAFSRVESHDRIAHIPYNDESKTSLEEFMYWAKIQRAAENDDKLSGGRGKTVFSDLSAVGKRVTGKKGDGAAASSDATDSIDSNDNEKGGVHSQASYVSQQLAGIPPQLAGKLDERRALRIAGASSVFFLITTDILGPNAAPYAMSQTGFATGNILYLVMGVMAYYAGYLLMQIYSQLDSIRHPIKTYADMADRVFGRWLAHIFTFLQSVQLVINVGLICLTNGQSLELLVATGTGNLCFAIAVLIWALVGMVFAQIRTLRGLSIFANFAVFMNLTIVFVSMGIYKEYGFNVQAVANNMNLTPDFINSHPVQTSATTTAPLPMEVNGIMNMVFAYGGAMIFPEIMAEMRHPLDFWKGLLAAELLIFCAYVLYGNFIYAYAGQYTLAVAFQGMFQGAASTACNVLNIITGLIAAAIYGNIGIKVLYIRTVEAMGGPQLLSRKGQIIWAFFSTTYWAVAYVLAMSIPQVATVSGLVAAVAIMNFSYSFPFMLALGIEVTKDAIDDEEWQPGQEKARRNWARGFFGGSRTLRIRGRTYQIPAFTYKLWLGVLTLGSFAMSGLGMYGSGISIQQTFDAGGATGTSWSCASTV